MISEITFLLSTLLKSRPLGQLAVEKSRRKISSSVYRYGLIIDKGSIQMVGLASSVDSDAPRLASYGMTVRSSEADTSRSMFGREDHRVGPTIMPERI